MKTNTLLKLLAVVSMIGFGSCTDAKRSQYGSLGKDHKVELLNCNGDVIKTWTSSGKVHSSEHSDGIYFRDKTTDVLVEISGDYIITVE